MSNIAFHLYNPMVRGYIDAKWPFKPLAVAKSDLAVHEVLDHIAAAVESGYLDTETWPDQLFASDADYQTFIEQLSDYDVCYRITDRWWFSLAGLLGISDEEGFISTEDIADTINVEYRALRARQAAAKVAKPKGKAVSEVTRAKVKGAKVVMPKVLY